VPLEVVAEGERVLHAVLRRAPLVDHLRLDLELLVGAEERVVDEVTVVARDVRGGPDGVEDLQIGLGDEPERAATLLGVHVRRGDRGRRRGGAADEGATGECGHEGYLLEGPEDSMVWSRGSGSCRLTAVWSSWFKKLSLPWSRPRLRCTFRFWGV
jgi:hypothetical protein